MGAEELGIVSVVVGEELLLNSIPDGTTRFIFNSLARIAEAVIGVGLIAGGDKLLGSFFLLKLLYHATAPNMKAISE